jgi:hypothetical protein
VENEYFDRATDAGKFELEIVGSPREISPPNFSLSLEDGSAYLNMALPTEIEVGDQLLLQATVRDAILDDLFVNMIKLTVGEKQVHPSGSKRQRRQEHSGKGDDAQSQQGIKLPPVISVRENDEHWLKYDFTPQTACHVISDPVEVDGETRLEHTFYINVENSSLKTEMKYKNQDPRLLEAKFKYGNVLLGLAMLHDAERSGGLQANGGASVVAESEARAANGEADSMSDTIRSVSSAIAPVLIPIIDQLSGLSEEHLEELSSRGEDA